MVHFNDIAVWVVFVLGCALSIGVLFLRLRRNASPGRDMLCIATSFLLAGCAALEITLRTEHYSMTPVCLCGAVTLLFLYGFLRLYLYRKFVPRYQVWFLTFVILFLSGGLFFAAYQEYGARVYYRTPGIVYHRFHDGVMVMEYSWREGAQFTNQRLESAGERMFYNYYNAAYIFLPAETGTYGSLYRQRKTPEGKMEQIHLYPRRFPDGQYKVVLERSLEEPQPFPFQ